ncbi:MAG: ribose-phosphate pyrophosphokinase [Planctomycetes bacterium]|nr:ribose-phosphate pyrophosphokinase [Planctomycetota bacterium]
MDWSELQNNPQFRMWLEHLIEDKVNEALEHDREQRFRDSFAVISVRKGDSLAEGIAGYLGKRLVDYDLIVFGDGEKKAVIKENLSGKHVYVIATVGENEDPDVSFANTCRIVSTLARTCKVARINVVAPCLWYQAQDKTHARREPISVRDVADDIIRRGMDHIMVMELHSEQIEIAFNSFDHLKITPIVGDYLNRRFERDHQPLVLISPDDGGVRTREDLYKNINPKYIAGQAAVHQLRVRGALDEKDLIDFVGEVGGRIGVIYDDLLRSGTTLFQAAAAAKNCGATKVIAAVAHFYGFDSKSMTFEEKLRRSGVDELIITNTRPDFVKKLTASSVYRSRITVLDIAPYLGRAIRNYQSGGTVKDMIYRVGDRREFYRVIHQAGNSL